MKTHRDKKDKEEWVKDPDTNSRKSGRMEPYIENDGRFDPIVCDHSQFLDKPGLRNGICLDCGATIVLGSWVVDFSVPPVSDEELMNLRVKFHEIWEI